MNFRRKATSFWRLTSSSSRELFRYDGAYQGAGQVASSTPPAQPPTPTGLGFRPGTVRALPGSAPPRRALRRGTGAKPTGSRITADGRANVLGVVLAAELRRLGLPLCPASCRIGGTSGSETKLCQPSASQSKSTQTRSSSFGSRKTCRTLGPVLLALLSALRREDLQEAVEVLDLRRCKDHLVSSAPPRRAARSRYRGQCTPQMPDKPPGARFQLASCIGVAARRREGGRTRQRGARRGGHADHRRQDHDHKSAAYVAPSCTRPRASPPTS